MIAEDIMALLQSCYHDTRPWWRRWGTWIRQHSPWRRPPGYTYVYEPTLRLTAGRPLDFWMPGGLAQDWKVYIEGKRRPYQWRATDKHRRQQRSRTPIRRPTTWIPGPGVTRAATSGATAS